MVIGNGRYAHTGRLEQAPEDAKAVAASLEHLGFDVTLRRDVDRPGFVRSLADFRQDLDAADVGFFYYAGHAIQVQGNNYMIPVDAELADPAYADADAVDARRVIQAMDLGGSGLNVIVLDACRDNPWSSRWVSSDKALDVSGLAELSAPSGKGFLLAYATDPGDVAADSGAYAASMVRHLQTECLSVARAFGRVRDDLERQTDGGQRPWLNLGAGEAAFQYIPAGCSPGPAAADTTALASEAERHRREAEMTRVALRARMLATQASDLLETGIGDMQSRGALLAVEAMRRSPSTEATRALHAALELRRPVVWQAAGGGLGPGPFVAFSPDGSRLVAVGDGYGAPGRVFDTATGEVRFTLTPGPSAIAADPAGAWLAGATEAEVVLWSSSDGSERLRLAHADVNALAFDATGSRIATASGATVHVWSTADGRSITSMTRRLSAEYPEAASLSFHRDGDRIASVVSVGDPADPESHRVDVWSIRKGGTVRQLTFEGPVGAATYSADGAVLAVGVRGTVRLFDADTYHERRRVGTDEARDMVSVGLDGSGSLVAAVGWDDPARVWRVSDGVEVARLEHERGAYGPGRISAIALSTKGSHAATLGDDQLRVWALTPDAAAHGSGARVGHRLPTGSGFARAPGEPLVSDDGRLVAEILPDGSMPRVTRDGSALPYLQRTEGVNWARFSPGGTLLVTSRDGITFLVVEVATGNVIAKATHDRPADTALFSADGGYLATASSADGTARIWDLSANRELLRWHLKTNLADVRIRFVDDDRLFEFVGTEYDDRTSRRTGLWRPADLITAACATVTRSLSTEEWSQYLGDATPRPTCPAPG